MKFIKEEVANYELQMIINHFTLLTTIHLFMEYILDPFRNSDETFSSKKLIFNQHLNIDIIKLVVCRRLIRNNNASTSCRNLPMPLNCENPT